MQMEKVFKNEKNGKNIVVLEYTRLDRYLNLEKKIAVLKFHLNNFSYFELSISLF